MKDNILEHLHETSLFELQSEKSEGLRIFTETAWGWSELKVAPFLKQLEGNNLTVVGYVDIGKSGNLIVKIPHNTK